MQLLTADHVAKEAKTLDTERAARAVKLRDAETTLVRKVNTRREEIRQEMADLEHQLAIFKELIEVRKGELDSDIYALVREVKKLEARREDALKPIHVVQEEAAARLTEALAKESAVERGREALAHDRRLITEEATALGRRVGDWTEKAAILDQRETFVVSEEARIGKLRIKLADEWTEYSLLATSKEREFESRESSTAAAHKANMAFRSTLEKQRQAQDDRDRQLRDRYASLAKAVKETEKRIKSYKV